MRTVLGRRLVAIVAFVILALATCAVIEFNVAKGLSWSAGFSTDAALVLAVALAAIVPVKKMVRWARGTLPLSNTTLNKAREDLARILASGWIEEERSRRINDPWPLPVRWSGQGTEQFSEIGDFFNGPASRRLVILGEAGAGKTALAVKLVLELLKTRKDGDPVPVLLAAATWTDSCTMTEWVARQLSLDHPGLAVAVKTGTGEIVSLARSLSVSEVLPVIDGLDELPENRRAPVIAEINAQGSDRPVVLTSRPDEYEAAIASREVTLATTISLEPLNVSHVRDYLNAATETPLDRWHPVFDVLDADSQAPLAQALTNPLMLWLARTVYERGETLPSELAGLPDREAVEGHLLAGFVPAAYASRSRTRGFRCTSTQAQRWLGFLAAWQNPASSPDITWWRLCLAERGWSSFSLALRSALYACVVWLVLAWALVRRGYWPTNGYFFHGQFRDLLLAGPLGRSVLPMTGPLVKGLPSGFDANVDTFLRYLTWLGVARTAGVVFLAAFIFGEVQASDPQTPRMTFAIFRTQVLSDWIWTAILAYMWWGSLPHHEQLAEIAPQWRTKLILIWLGVLTARRVLSSLAVPVDVSSVAEPDGLLRRTRWVFLLGCLASVAEVAVVWLWAGTTLAIAFGLITVTQLVAVSESDAGGAWPRYLHAKFRLYARRRLPWRTLSFLADAHRRGVLRQVGGAYQFRHIRLQEQLAAGYSSWPPTAAPWVRRARGAAKDAEALVEAKLASWRTGSQDVTTSPDTVSGVIPVLSPSDVVKDYVAASIPALAAGVALVMFAAAARWYLGCAGLLLAGGTLLLSTRVRLRYHKAGTEIVPRSWSLETASDEILVTRDGITVSVPMSDIEQLAVARVRGTDGSRTEWTALHARLSEGSEVPFPTRRRSLPLAWLSRGPLKGGYRSLPELVTVIRWFPNEVLSAELAELKQVTAREYTTSGLIEDPPVPWTDAVLPGFAVTLTLFLFGQRGVGFVCLVGSMSMLGICLYRINRRAALHELPRGPWSLHVSPDGIDIEINGVHTHLAPDDILEADLRALRYEKGKDSKLSTVQVRLRPRAPVASDIREGWLSVYREPISTASSETPTELVAALHGLLGSRFGPKLSDLAKAKKVIQD